MTKSLNRLFLMSAILCTALWTQTVYADQALLPASATNPFTVLLPDVDRAALVEKIRTLRSRLIQHKQVLLQRVAEKKMNGSDAIITAIMPGGLLYAGYKKARHRQAKNDLERVSDDIEAFSSDLSAMQSAATPLIVATLP